MLVIQVVEVMKLFRLELRVLLLIKLLLQIPIDNHYVKLIVTIGLRKET